MVIEIRKPCQRFNWTVQSSSACEEQCSKTFWWRLKHSVKMLASFSNLKVGIRELSFPFMQERTKKQLLRRGQLRSNDFELTIFWTSWIWLASWDRWFCCASCTVLSCSGKLIHVYHKSGYLVYKSHELLVLYKSILLTTNNCKTCPKTFRFMMSLPVSCLGDMLFMSRKDGTGGGWIHVRGENSMRVPWLGSVDHFFCLKHKWT